MLSVISVNYNSSALLKECLFSIVSAVEDIPVEFIVIDSGSCEEDVNALRRLEGENVKVVLSRENIGYARAVNTGIKNAAGDFILITNPDVLYKPNSIKKMLDALKEFPRCGAVGPKTWWDKQMTFMFPHSELFTPYRMVRTELINVSRTFRHMILRRWLKKALKYWLSEKPLRQEMLSGGCIMTTRRILDITGGFDEAFPLYFEDADWCLRVQKAGLRLYMIPDANVIHYYSHSAQQDISASQRKFDYSLDKYLRKHFNGRSYLIDRVRKLLQGCRRRNKDRYNDMGILAEPPVLRFKGVSKKLFLLSPFDTLIPSAGSFFEDDSFEIPGDMWDSMGDGRYFAGVFSVDRLGHFMSWSWIKRSKN